MWNNVFEPFNVVSVYAEFFLFIIVQILLIYLVLLNYSYLNKIIWNKIAFVLTNLSIIFLSFFFYFELEFFSFNPLFLSDLFSLNVKLVVGFFLFCISFLSNDYLKKEKIIDFEYYIILIISFIAFVFVISSTDFLSVYLGIELQSLCFYILATFKQYSNFSSEAGIKYFILGAFSSGLLLFGFSFIYGFTGVSDFYSLELLGQAEEFPNELLKGLSIGILFVLVALLFKLSVAPFHMWAPDVYEGSPTIVTIFFSILPKIVILSLFVKLVVKIFDHNFYYFNQFLMFCAILSLIIGTLGGLYQTKIKRLLAYGGITHFGFILIGLAVSSFDSFVAVFLYILIYAFLSLNQFSLFLSLRKRVNLLKLKKIHEVIFFYKSNFFLSIIFCFTLFSAAGIPPLLGFYSKLYIFITGILSTYLIIVIFAALISAIASLYYIRLIKLMFFNNIKFILFTEQVNYFNAFLISLTFLINFFFLFWPNLIIIYLQNWIFNLTL